MMRRVPPLRYQSSEGRLVDYEVAFEIAEEFPIDLWAYTLDKTYIPWETWEAYEAGGAPRLPSTPPSYVGGPFALKTLPKEGERTLEDITVRIRQETSVLQQEGWHLRAYERRFRFMSPALADALSDALPWLQDPGAYHWDKVRNILVGFVDAAALDYPQLRDPGYFEARRLEALNLWQVLECIAQALAAKWELGFGECEYNPNPDAFQLPDLDPAVEVAGWMLNRFPAVRDGELPIPFSRFVEQHRLELQPQANLQSVQELADAFGDGAVPDLFGEVWAQRFGYEALLADLEQQLATPEQLIGLGWLFNQRLLR